ncbi:MAG: CAP domain-containing protein [Planctomycetota bacterium]|jgi:hypothetical protein
MNRLKYLIFAVVVFVLLGGGCGDKKKKPFYYDPTHPANRPDDAVILLTMVNDFRANNSLTVLSVDPLIEAAAIGYANFCAYYWSDTGMVPYADDFDGLTPFDRLTNAGVSFTGCDETGVIEMGWNDASFAFSVINQTKLLDPNLTRIGIAAVEFS